jgi:hypothetical protein
MEAMEGSSSSDDEFFSGYTSIGNWADYQEMIDIEEEQTRLRNAVNIRAVLDKIPVSHHQVASVGGSTLHLTAPKKRKEANPWKANPGALREIMGGRRVPLGHTIQIHFDNEEEQEEQEEQERSKENRQEEKQVVSTRKKDNLFAPPRRIPEWKKQEEEKQINGDVRKPRREKKKVQEIPPKKISVRKDSLVEYLKEPSVPHDPTPLVSPAPAPAPEVEPEATITTENHYYALQESVCVKTDEVMELETEVENEDVEKEKELAILSKRHKRRQQKQEQRDALLKKARLENGLTLFAIFLFGLLLGLFRSSST